MHTQTQIHTGILLQKDAIWLDIKTQTAPYTQNPSY